MIRCRSRVLLAGIAILLGCTMEPDPEREPVSGPPTLVVAAPSGFSGVNELLSSSQMDQEIRHHLFLQLLEEQPDYQEHPPTFAPELARDWEFSDDGLAITFFLRDDLVWSDGEPITAADVRFTWRAQTSADVGWAAASIKEPIVDVEVVDPQTVRFHFSRTYATQLLDANEGFILPRHAWSELPMDEWRRSAGWFEDHLVVSGPYAIVDHDPRQRLVLGPNPRPNGDGPRIERVVFRVLPDESARLNQLLAGRVDVMQGIPPARVEEVKSHPEVELHEVWARQYTFIGWNTRRQPFDDAAVRRALTMGIDRRELVEALWNGHARIATSPIPSTVWAHADIDPWPHDPSRARDLLAERGWRDSDGDDILDKDGEPFAFELSTNTGNRLRRDALVLIQEQLRRVGVDARPSFFEFATLISKNEAGDFDATLAAWGIDTGLDLSYAFGSGEPTNFGRYASSEVDRLLEEVANSDDLAAAEPHLRRIQEILHVEQPYTFLWEPQWLVGTRSRVRGARPSALLTFADLDEWWLAGDA